MCALLLSLLEQSYWKSRIKGFLIQIGKKQSQNLVRREKLNMFTTANVLFEKRQFFAALNWAEDKIGQKRSTRPNCVINSTYHVSFYSVLTDQILLCFSAILRWWPIFRNSRLGKNPWSLCNIACWRLHHSFVMHILSVFAKNMT